MKHFQLNCDVGENTGDDAALMPYLDACSIACGGHTGDVHTMRQTVLLAMEHQVEIGAHPSFPDKENFGRKVVKIKADDLIKSIRTQIYSLLEICKEMNVAVEHVKPHGALYNLASRNEETAKAVIEAMKDLKGLTLLAPWRSLLAELATAANIPVRTEAFADRTYTRDLALVAREHPEAIISDPSKAGRQVLTIFNNHQVETIEGEMVELHAQTFCVHSDNPAAENLVKDLYSIRNAK